MQAISTFFEADERTYAFEVNEDVVYIKVKDIFIFSIASVSINVYSGPFRGPMVTTVSAEGVLRLKTGKDVTARIDVKSLNDIISAMPCETINAKLSINE